MDQVRSQLAVSQQQLIATAAAAAAAAAGQQQFMNQQQMQQRAAAAAAAAAAALSNHTLVSKIRHPFMHTTCFLILLRAQYFIILIVCNVAC